MNRSSSEYIYSRWIYTECQTTDPATSNSSITDNTDTATITTDEEIYFQQQQQYSPNKNSYQQQQPLYPYPQRDYIYPSPVKHHHHQNYRGNFGLTTTAYPSPSQFQQQQSNSRTYQFCALNVKDLFHSFCNDPVHLDDYWLDYNRCAHLGRDRFKKFYYDGDEMHQQFHFDLNHGYETFDERLQRPLDEGLASICKYLLLKYPSNRSVINLREAVQFADFACFRGTLKKFAATFFEAQRPKDHGWKFLIVKLQGVFFIQELETDARQQERAMETAGDKLATYWGLKFERYILAENGKIPDSMSPVSTMVQTNAIFKLKFNPLPAIPKPITVFYSAEIDGISKEGKHMEVKTRNHRSMIQHRAMNWWLQCRLANINSITIGMRQDGIVKSLESCSIYKLENLHCIHPKRTYDFDIALNSIHYFLYQIKTFYNNHLKMNEVLIVERKPMDLNVQCSIQKAKYHQIFSKEFLHVFGPKHY